MNRYTIEYENSDGDINDVSIKASYETQAMELFWDAIQGAKNITKITLERENIQ